MLNESRGCHLRRVRSISSLSFYFVENPVITEDPNQRPHNVASDLGLPCLPMALLRVSR